MFPPFPFSPAPAVAPDNSIRQQHGCSVAAGEWNVARGWSLVLLREAGIEPRVRGVHLHDNTRTLQSPPFSLSLFFFAYRKGCGMLRVCIGKGRKGRVVFTSLLLVSISWSFEIKCAHFTVCMWERKSKSRTVICWRIFRIPAAFYELSD